MCTVTLPPAASPVGGCTQPLPPDAPLHLPLVLDAGHTAPESRERLADTARLPQGSVALHPPCCRPAAGVIADTACLHPPPMPLLGPSADLPPLLGLSPGAESPYGGGASLGGGGGGLHLQQPEQRGCWPRRGCPGPAHGRPGPVHGCPGPTQTVLAPPTAVLAPPTAAMAPPGRLGPAHDRPSPTQTVLALPMAVLAPPTAALAPPRPSRPRPRPSWPSPGRPGIRRRHLPAAT